MCRIVAWKMCQKCARKRRLVGLRGLEPPPLAGHGPKPCASASSATSPWAKCINFKACSHADRAIGVKTSNETILYSRNHKNFNTRFPQIAEALDDLPADTVIDGEVVALDESGRPDFHRLQHFTAEASRIHYFVFDLLILHIPSARSETESTNSMMQGIQSQFDTREAYLCLPNLNS